MKRLKYTRRFVNVQLTGGKRKVRNEEQPSTMIGCDGLERTCAVHRPNPPRPGLGSHTSTDEPQPRCGLIALLSLQCNDPGPDRRIETSEFADTAHRGTNDCYHHGKWEGRVILEHGLADGFLGVGHYANFAHVSALGRRVPLQSGTRGRPVLGLRERLRNSNDLSGPKRFVSLFCDGN